MTDEQTLDTFIPDWTTLDLLADSEIELNELRVDYRELREAASNLIADVKSRYPNEDLKCEYMIALDKALQQRNKP